LFLDGIIAGTTHLCVGQEACAVGTCMALTPDDCIFSNHRGHGHLLGRGADPGKVMAEIFGSPRGYAGGRGGSQHMAIRELNFMGTHGITGGSIPLAAGVALHKKLHKEPGVGVVFFSDGAVGEGAFHETLNMAAMWNLPALFICENNLYAMSTSFEKTSPVTDVAERAKAYGMEGMIVDGNDVEAVFDAVSKARAMAEDTPQPVLIELKTFRASGHSRGDKCLYRTREEEAYWTDRDPIETTVRCLQDRHSWSDDERATIDATVMDQIAVAEAYAKGEDDA
jgi:TPP-dependent pyruvate/acetoin dehydrogenase alpha subunit